MSQKDILIADDSVMVRNHFIGILGGAGFQVSEATNGLEALKTLKSKKINLLLLDLEMPEMNGFEVLRMIKNDIESENLRILCITSVHTKLDDIHKVMELGAKGYIKKDCSDEDLLFRVNKVFAEG